MIYVDPQGMLTVAGGKWTTYRAMAEEGIDRAVKEYNLRYVQYLSFSMISQLMICLRYDLTGQDRGSQIEKCVTENVRLIGSDQWGRNMFIGLIQRVRYFGLPLYSCSILTLISTSMDLTMR